MEKRKNIIIISIYIIALIMFNIKINYYQKNIYIYPDECSHIAYIAYLEQTNKLIPEFENMKELSIGTFLKEYDNSIDEREVATKIQEAVKSGEDVTIKLNENTINHLGHPPLYYHIMKIFNIVNVENGEVTYNLRELRNASQVLANIGLILAFIIGYKKLKSVTSNLIYASLIVCVPQLSFISGAVSNDVLSLVGVNVFLLGAIRLEEKNRNYLTYFLIAIGIFICALNKLTALTILFFACIFIIILLTIREKNLKFIFCKQALATLPIYMLILAYFIIIYTRYGAINPSLIHINPEYYRLTEFYDTDIYVPAYSLKYYAKIFWQGFLNYWAGYEYYRESTNFNQVIPSALIILFPFINLIYKKIKKEKIDIVNISVALSTIIAIIIQFVRQCIEFYTVSGYLGGNQPRYYLCVMPSFMLLISEVVEKSISKDKKNIKKIIYIAICVGYIASIEIGLW